MSINFSSYLTWSKTELLTKYVEIAQELANLYNQIAYLRCEEIRDKSVSKTDRVELEGQRDVLVEERFLIARLLDI